LSQFHYGAWERTILPLNYSRIKNHFILIFSKNFCKKFFSSSLSGSSSPSFKIGKATTFSSSFFRFNSSRAVFSIKSSLSA